MRGCQINVINHITVMEGPPLFLLENPLGVEGQRGVRGGSEGGQRGAEGGQRGVRGGSEVCVCVCVCV